MKLIAWYDDGWFDSDVTDWRMWDHLCRAYGVELQMIREWREATIPEGSLIYLIAEDGTVEMSDHAVDRKGIYVFGRTHLDLLLEVGDYEASIHIGTPHPVSLFGIVAAAMLLSRMS